MVPTHWFQIEWPSAWSSIDISVKELVPIVVVAALWGESWTAKRICFHFGSSGNVTE